MINITVKNEKTENIAIEEMEIIVLDVKGEEVLKVNSEVNKTLSPNENIIISSQTKSNLDSNQVYTLKVNY